MEEDENPNSQASSHFCLDPIPASVLLDQEVARRDGLKRRGNIMTGCRELDDNALLGGFERGNVVGLSAEDDEVGLLIALQTIARLLAASGKSQDSSAGPRAVIITTLSASVLLPTLRNVIVAQLEGDHGGPPDLNGRVRAILERVSISRVFDFEGLWEVLGELDPTPDLGSTPEARQEAATIQPGVPPCETEPPPEDGNKTVIQDSEDEDDLSPTQSAGHSPEVSVPPAVPPQPSDKPDTCAAARAGTQPAPDIILITHMSSLLTALFTRREKAAAHSMLQLLSSHLRFLTRSAAHGAPLILALNSTSSAAGHRPLGNDRGLPAAGHRDAATRSRAASTTTTTTTKPLDPTLRSIFSPAPHQTSYGYGYGYGYGAEASPRGHNNNATINKPSFGLVFAQLLDIHLLCSRVPRTRADAEAVFAPRPTPASASVMQTRFAWVVEVLLDEVGVWEEAGGFGGRWGAGPRRSRERRWGAVDVVDGVRVVDAFGLGEGRIG